MLTLNYRDSRPIYEQIRDGLKKLIVSGAMSPDEKLPSVRALAQQLSINPNTIQRAYNELENEGFIYSIPGKGSFAAAVVDGGESRKRELVEKIRELAAELRYLGVDEEELAALVKECPASFSKGTGEEEPV
ncbi:MAG: GntR family transcriptional regulator [Ruminococcaceae bacterium]|nr:GntR family transcriptional regulator [Oscillospiraceae bacterium]